MILKAFFNLKKRQLKIIKKECSLKIGTVYHLFKIHNTNLMDFRRRRTCFDFKRSNYQLLLED